MNNKQYEEYLLSILTYCESLNSSQNINYREGNPFGMSYSDFFMMIRDLHQNNYIDAILYIGGVILNSLTPDGREKLEQLREKLK